MILLFLAIIVPGNRTVYTACQKGRMQSEERKRRSSTARFLLHVLMTSLFGVTTASSHTHKALHISFWEGGHKSLHKKFSHLRKHWLSCHPDVRFIVLNETNHQCIYITTAPDCGNAHFTGPSLCASHFAHIIKTWGKQLVRTTV